MYELLDAGVPNIFLKSGYVFRETRYGRGVSITNVEGLTRAIIIALCLRGGRLRGVEFRYIRRAIGLTQEALSKLFDRTEQTIANWEKRNQVPLEASLLLKEQALVQFDLGHLVHQVLGQLGQSHLSDEMIILSFDPHRLIWTSNFHAPATKPHAFVGYTAHTTSGSSWLFGSEQETTTHDYLPRKTRAKFAHYVPPTRTYQYHPINLTVTTDRDDFEMAKSRRSERALRITDDSRLTAPVSSADNISFILGMPVTKIFFHNTVDFDNETGDEIEQTSSIITVPTLSLLQFCKGALDAFDAKKKDIDALIDEYRANLLDVSSCSAYQEVAPTPKSRKTPKRSID